MALSIFAAAAEAPDRPAIVTDERSITYLELAGRVRHAIAWLRDRFLDGPAPVGLLAANDVPTVEMLHALMALGTPALLLHPRLTAGERQALLDAVSPAGVVDPDWPTAPAAGSRADPDPVPPPDDDTPLAIVQTSGTSGSPKGAVLSRRAFTASAAASAANLRWRDDDRWLLPLPLAHVGGLSIVTRCLLARRTVVLAEGTEPEPLLDSVRRHRVTLLSLVPTLLARILDLEAGATAPPSLRAVLLGGAAASPTLLERAAGAWPVLTTYGLTEACSQVTTQPFGTVNRGQLGAGPPLPGIELRIGDDDEIQVRGPNLFTRYLPPAVDPDPFLDDGWFPTGDRGRIDDDGNLHVLGRRADRIVTGGENVDPVEVERALERLPGIRQACVFGAPDEEWGEVVCAAIVVDEQEAASGESLGVLRDELASFKLPRRVAVLESLPVNATGKVDRREAAKRAEERLRPRVEIEIEIEIEDRGSRIDDR